MSVESRCSKRIVSGEPGDNYSRMCSLKAIVERDGRRYCRVHDPEVVAERKKALHAKWAAQSAADRKRWSTEKALHRIAIAAVAYVRSVGDGTGKLWDELSQAVAALTKIESGE